MFLSPTTVNEVESAIKELQDKKATGPNSIPSKILKNNKDVLSKPLCDLINLPFVSVNFLQLKTAKIIPVYKKGDPLDCTNYHPISVLSNLGKLIEKLIHSRMNKFLENHKCFYKNQFGFRKKQSTNHALITITEKIQNALDNNQYACGVFLDFQKAFDTVNHKILLSKLECYGIRSIPHDLIKSYLTNRKHTHINGVDSNTLTSTHGVPQGSVLGPLLFLIYINDMSRVIQHSEIHHFVDDTNFLIYSSNSMKKINRYINHNLKVIVHWLRANRISVSVDKTKIVIFRPKGKDITKKLNFRISGQQIYISKQVKYLGLMLDESLTWLSHISMLKTKLRRANVLLVKLRHYTSSKLLTAIYNALFESHMRYGCQIWG